MTAVGIAVAVSAMAVAVWTSSPLFLLPGLGADERLFDAHRVLRDVRPIRWIDPAHPREPLTSYAERLARTLPANEPFDLGGASFGGMVALEVARHCAPGRVYLFGSCRSPRAIPPVLRALRRMPAVRPPRWSQPLVARWFGATSAEHVRIFMDMLAATPVPFMRWATRAIFSWEGVPELPMPVHHIHGDRDRLIPVRRVRPDRVIQGAGHLLNLTHPDAVNAFLAEMQELPTG